MELLTRAKQLGIQAEFIDGQGHRHVTDAAALRIILDALPAELPRRLLDGPVVIRFGKPARTRLGQAAKSPVHWKIVAGPRVIAEGEAKGDTINWPADLAVGTYQLQLADAASVAEEVPLLVAPRAAFAGDFDRCWLLAVQLYSIRSERNWGIGDFTDLEGLIALAAGLGAGGVGLNPLHALFDDRPGDCSPYSPNSRLFLNPLYVDVEKLAGVVAPAGVQQVRQGDLIDYPAVAKLKWPALRAAFKKFKADSAAGNRDDFEEFRAERGRLLTRFACFEVLRHKFNKPWWEWPEPWRQPDEAACAGLREGKDGAEIEFVEFVQWVADRQLRDCRDLAAKLGMKVGLYLDVAVGVQSDGFDAWNEQAAISRHLAVGAPPDPLNTAGQNWGLAGFNAAGLAMTSFEPFRQMLWASMRYAGAIRLDHVLGLKRLYLVPHGFAPNNGVYVQMPFEALLAATAQESATHRCVVIGEDLGTVPEGFREQMADWGIWSYLVMMFERDSRGAFYGLDYYKANALVTLNTHDLSTYAGWRSFGDLKLKRSIGIDPGESDDARWQALTALSDTLRAHGVEGHDLYAVTGFLARTKSRLLTISLEDILGLLDQPNIPGTVDEHPNWRRRLPVAVGDISAAIDTAGLKTAMQGRAGSAIETRALQR
jgi:4-alpha-glucanotransferase